MTEVSFLAAIFGVLTCVGVFDCDRDFDSYGGIVLWFALCIYMFKQLGTICDEYFVPSLEVIVEKLEMSNDVAGATFMAAGSSAPELFTSLVATFFIVNEGGVGTIVGSAIFNILVIVGATGWCACKESALEIWWYPLTRDCIFYVISITELMLVLWDEEVMLYEAVIMVLTYFLYIFYMWLNPSIILYFGLVEPCDEEEELVDTQEVVDECDQNEDDRMGSKASGMDASLPSGTSGDADAPSSWQDPVVEVIGAEKEIIVQGPAVVVNGEIPVIVKNGELPNVVPGCVEGGEDEPKMARVLSAPNTSVEEVERGMARTLTAPPLGASGAADADGNLRNSGASGEGGEGGEIKVQRAGTKTLTATLERAPTLKRAGSTRQLSNGPVRMSHRGLQDDLRETSKSDSKPAPVAAKPVAPKLDPVNSESLQALTPVIPSSASDTAPPETKLVATAGAETKAEGKDAETESFDAASNKSEEKEAKGIFKYLRDPISWALETFMPTPARHWSLFTLSIGCIAIATYVMVDSVNRAGTILKVPPMVMGLTVLAAGTSIPDAMGSIAVAKQGEGDMAVANALGSNIFDILVGLGVPWMIRRAMGNEVTFEGKMKYMASDIVILASVLLIFVGALLLNRWRLTRGVGVVLITFYFANVLYNILAVYVFKTKVDEDS